MSAGTTSSDFSAANANCSSSSQRGTIRPSNSDLSFAVMIRLKSATLVGVSARSHNSRSSFAPVPETNRSSASGYVRRFSNKSPRMLRPVVAFFRHRSAMDQSRPCFCRLTEWNWSVLAGVCRWELDTFRFVTERFDCDRCKLPQEHVEDGVNRPNRFVLVAELVSFSSGPRHVS